jgi:hypothetical protein
MTAFAAQAPNPRRHNPGSYEKLYGATLRPPWNWRVRFLTVSLPPKHARIAITPDTVRPAHGAAIVEVEKDESGGNWDSNGRFFGSYRRAGV